MSRIGAEICTSDEAVARARLPKLMAMLVESDIRFHFEHGPGGYKLTLPDLRAEEFVEFAKSERIQLAPMYVDNTELW